MVNEVDIDRDFKGIWIPREVWFDERLNMLDKGILMEIDSLDISEDGCWASNEYLAEFCQCSATKVSTSVSKLIKLGYIRVLKFDGRKRFLRTCFTERELQHFKNCESDFKSLKERKILRNILSNNKDDDDNVRARAREYDTPEEAPNAFGDADYRPNAGTIQQYVTNSVISMSARAMEQLNDYLKDLPEPVVRHGVDNALDAGKRTWNYIRAILNSYVDAGVKSVQEAVDVDKKHNQKYAQAEKTRQSYSAGRKTAAQESDDFWKNVPRF